jgi:hypothetical protein
MLGVEDEMRGSDGLSGYLFSYVDLEAKVWSFTLAAAAYNLVRELKLLAGGG